MSRVRVLVLIKGLGVGGAERLLVDMLAVRDRERFDYEVAYVTAAQGALAGAVEGLGVPVHPLGAGASADVRWTARLRSLLGAGHYDVVHAHLPYTAAFGRLAALSLGRRRPVLLYTEHSLWSKAAVLTKALNRLTVGLDDGLVVVSEAARQALPPALRDRARVVVHGIDRTRFALPADERHALRAAVRSELGAGDDDVVALTVANLRTEKGYDVLVAAAPVALAAAPSLRFVWVGRGPLQDEVASAAAAPALGGRARFLGPRPDAARLMAAADLFVLPSHQEGLPVALMEAMSAGLPVVATTVGGVPGVVRHEGEGLLVAPGRPDELAAAVARVAGDAELRGRLAAASAARSALFDVRESARAIEAVYDELLAARAARRRGR
ncbi:MAG TPA: glycosyltransferase [Acidimicrobiales bacterium]|nr:glycosyltransferase [Acidimicrobiales bacterium]